MDNICTPETAKRLKDAGFPQPEPAPGQVWYKDEKPWIRITGAYWVELINGFTHSDPRFTPDCYAATAPDILRGLGKEWAISSVGDEWCCDNVYAAASKNNNCIVDINPAEACAKAWLAQNKR